jgi:hypothetical protein
MEKYGFVYIWYDRKHKRYYIGCRWGSIDDGYICSSPWMKRGYKTRPSDFKRRILKTNISRNDLLEEEYKWLSKIKPEELGKRYYNIHNRHFKHWSTDENKRLSVGQKISETKKGKPANKQQIDAMTSGRNKWNSLSTEEKAKRKKKQPKELYQKIVESRRKNGGYKHSPETIEKIKNTKKNSGYKHSEETKEKIKMNNWQTKMKKIRLEMEITNA